MRESKKMALGGMAAALSLVILLLGSALGLGTYAAPMFAAPLLSPIGRSMGRKYHLLLWLAVSLLSFFLVTDLEQNLIYFALLGPYPLLRPWFQEKPRGVRLLLKVLWFNLVTLAVEALLLLVLAPEAMEPGMALLLLALANPVFLLYDAIIPRLEGLAARAMRLSRQGNG